MEDRNIFPTIDKESLSTLNTANLNTFLEIRKQTHSTRSDRCPRAAQVCCHLGQSKFQKMCVNNWEKL